MNRTINIIGAGRVGRTLGHLFAQHQVFAVSHILNRSLQSGQEAAGFIGAGTAVANLAEMAVADVYLLSVADDRIGSCCAELVGAGHIRPGTLVFHSSGSLASSALDVAAAAGALVASVHPVRSFADPQQVASNFTGTFCSMEGMAGALAELGPAFEAIGARTVQIDGARKTLYHAASVFACNYAVTLLDVALQTYAAAGIAHETAVEMAQPLVLETIANVFRLGPEKALTGPIARGDLETVARQQQALDAWNPQAGAAYRALALATLELAERRPKPECPTTGESDPQGSLGT